MQRIVLSIFFLAFTLGGCANQKPESQLKRKDTVRVCQDGKCLEQASSLVTFQAEPVDAASEQRLQELSTLAEQDAMAAFDLGLRLLRGDAVKRDSYRGIQWLRNAGDAGLLAAQLLLGQMYLTGYEEMGPDAAEADAWLTLAAAQGSSEAQELLPEARAARQLEHDNYQMRELTRKDLGRWYFSAPYYWHWRGDSWYLR